MSTIWKLDPTHSEITFKVKHMMISNIKGEFRKFDAEIQSEDDTFLNAKVTATVAVDSIDTNNSDRDQHLKSADFFDVENYPSISFTSKSLNNLVDGTISIHGIS